MHLVLFSLMKCTLSSCEIHNTSTSFLILIKNNQILKFFLNTSDTWVEFVEGRSESLAFAFRLRAVKPGKEPSGGGFFGQWFVGTLVHSRSSACFGKPSVL